MLNKIAGWSIFVAIVLVVAATIFDDNRDRTFRTDVATCRDVREILGDGIPSDIAAFCKTIDDEVQARKQKTEGDDIWYLTNRAAQEE